MPHVIVKLWPGPSEKAKKKLADAIVKSLIDSINTTEDSVSVAIEEIQSNEWMEKVYRPEIETTMTKLYKKPGYAPF